VARRVGGRGRGSAGSNTASITGRSKGGSGWWGLFLVLPTFHYTRKLDVKQAGYGFKPLATSPERLRGRDLHLGSTRPLYISTTSTRIPPRIARIVCRKVWVSRSRDTLSEGSNRAQDGATGALTRSKIVSCHGKEFLFVVCQTISTGG
jgi:hypothetical protein